MQRATPVLNKTLEFSDLVEPEIKSTVSSINHWLWRWTLTGGKVAVNGSVKRRAYIRRHKMWEYARGLALTGASAPARDSSGRHLTVLDVGGAMTATIFYLAGLGDRVLSLDIDAMLAEQTNRIARARRLPAEARTTNLAAEDPSPGDLGVKDGFDRVYCFCVIEHVLPPGQALLARRMGQLVRPGGLMCLTFDYGDDAPTEAPIRRVEDVETLCDHVGLPLRGNPSFADNGQRFPLNRRHPGQRYTFGSLFFHRPE